MSIKQIGDVNMISTRNVETKMNYVFLRSYMGRDKKELRRTKDLEIISIEIKITQGNFLRAVCLLSSSSVIHAILFTLSGQII